jgi:hypothetical protein
MTKIRKGIKVQLPSGRTKVWDVEHAPHPLYHKNNSNRFSFLWNPYHSAKGKMLQFALKPVILQGIERVWKDLCEYDEEAYVYDDPALFKLNQILTSGILELFQDAMERADWEKAGISEIGGTLRKQKIMLQLKDIFLFTLKEDVYYRPRILELGKRIAPVLEEWNPTELEQKYMRMARDSKVKTEIEV